MRLFRNMLLEKKSTNRSLPFFDEALVRSQVRMIKNQVTKDTGTSIRPRTPQFFPKSSLENTTKSLIFDNSRTITPNQTASPLKRDQNQQTSPRNDQN